ncbi:hypothetical protein DKG75_01350 [Zavarzinia compransoris]|uniref:Uncharacterized protein n=2 Tax=Zavarzinia compransoris TaxID=1264899 RepID=A0A317EAC5_9PROT|nr:hypothetical protein DKG75_01350 [Zavarzinia compransoris]
MKDAPHLESEFRALRQMGMHFFPALANGQVVVVCRMTARTGARRVVYLLFSPRTTREQLQEFFKRCRIAQTAPANANPLLWNPFKLRRANDPL